MNVSEDAVELAFNAALTAALNATLDATLDATFGAAVSAAVASAIVDVDVAIDVTAAALWTREAVLRRRSRSHVPPKPLSPIAGPIDGPFLIDAPPRALSPKSR